MKKSLFLKQLLLLVLLFNFELFAVSETQIKAVFLEKFTHLIKWPKQQKESFVVCVINNEKFAKALKEIYKKKQFQNTRVLVKSISSGDEIPSCQLLYLGKGIQKVDELLNNISGKPVLTVSDQQEYISKNIMIIIFLQQKHFKYIINNKAAKDADMKISYLLLQSAQKVIQ